MKYLAFIFLCQPTFKGDTLIKFHKEADTAGRYMFEGKYAYDHLVDTTKDSISLKYLRYWEKGYGDFYFPNH